MEKRNPFIDEYTALLTTEILILFVIKSWEIVLVTHWDYVIGYVFCAKSMTLFFVCDADTF